MANFEVHAYNLTTGYDLVAGDEPQGVVVSLAEAIIASIAPTSWDVMGGGGTVRVFHREVDTRSWFLVVRQSKENHEIIEKLLGQLRPN